VIARPGVFVFSELAPAHPPLAHSIHASGLVNIFAYATELAPAHPPLAHSIHASGLVNIFVYPTELAPAHPPLAFAVTPPGWLDYALMRISNARPGGFLFYLGRSFVGPVRKAASVDPLAWAIRDNRPYRSSSAYNWKLVGSVIPNGPCQGLSIGD
jgi:hypothetical protein